MEEERARLRQQAMFQANVRREALKQKAQRERDELLQHHLITTSEELQQALWTIDTALREKKQEILQQIFSCARSRSH